MTRAFRNIILFLLLTPISWSLNAQQRPWINYTSEDGLPTNYCYGAIEGDDGTIWIYTEDGLVRFDGNSFETFTVQNGLAGNDVFLAERDRFDRVILATFGKGGNFIQNDSLKIVPYEKGNQFNRIGDRMIVRSGESFINSESKYYQFLGTNSWSKGMDLDNSRLRSYEYTDPTTSMKCFIEFDKSTLHFSNNLGEEFNFKIKAFDIGFGSFLENRIEEQFNRFILIFSEGFVIFDTNSKELSTYSWKELGMDAPEVSNAQYIHPFLFLQTNEGFVKIDSSSQVVEQFIVGELAEQVELRRIISDSEGNIWAGSRDGGMFFLSHQNRTAEVIVAATKETGVFEKLISRNDNSLVAITDRAFIFEIEQDKVKKELSYESFGSFSDATLMEEDKIYANFSFKSALIDNQLVAKDHFINMRPKDLSHIDSRWMTDNISLFTRNFKKAAWDRSTQSLYLTKYDLFKANKITNDRISISDYQISPFDISSASDGGIWITSPGYISKLKQDVLDTFLIDSKLAYVNLIHEQDQKLWVSTAKGELLIIDIENRKIENEFELPSINSIENGLNKSTLVCTDNGLYKFKNQKINYIWKMSGGLSGNQVFHAVENQFGIYVATNKGLNKISSRIPEKRDLDFEFSVNEVLVNNKAIEFNGNSIKLNSNQNNINLSFNLKDYASAGDIQYYTRLKPFQKDWELREKGSVTFLGLTSDDYILELKAKRFNGEEILYRDKIKISVHPPIWKDPWTYFALSGLFFLGFYYRSRRLQKRRHEQFKKEKEVAKQISDLQLSALRSQMNPHFIFNALGAIQFFVQTKETDKADDYLSQFAMLMRMYLEASKEPLISLNDEIELLKLYVSIEEMRFDQQFKTHFDIDENLDLLDIKMPSVLIQPFVENAILHGLQPREKAGGLLKISFHLNGNELVVKISDNGIGIEAARLKKNTLHQSRGIENINARIQTLTVTSDQQISFDTRTPYPEHAQFPGHEVIITFENLVE